MAAIIREFNALKSQGAFSNQTDFRAQFRGITATNPS